MINDTRAQSDVLHESPRVGKVTPEDYCALADDYADQSE